LTLEEAFAGTTRRLSVKHEGHARSVEVRIPAGVGEGSRVRVAGEGGHGTGGATAGDLYLRIRLLPHARFERKERDLYTRSAIPVTVAVLGGEVGVPAIDGHTLRLRVPPSTQNGQVLRLKGHGMPTVGKPDQRGDLYVTVDIRLPRQLSPEQKRLFEELARLEDGAEPQRTQS
jgi:DnaJ-class molecular chaperone